MDTTRLADLVDTSDSATLAGALTEVDKMPTTPGSVGVRAALIGELERRHPEAAAAVTAAFDASEVAAAESGTDAEPVDYVTVLVEALPAHAKPDLAQVAHAVRLHTAINGDNGPLSATEQAMLRLEAEASTSTMAPGAKLERIRALGLTELAYYQALNALIDTERALAAAGPLVNRLRRLRSGSIRHRAVAGRSI